MKNVYTATFVENNGTYYARVPDLPGCITTGRNLPDAIEQITDAANLWLVTAEDHGNPLPPATAQCDVECPEGASLTMIQVDTIAYRAATDTRAVRKSVSLPAWLAKLADKRGINCSQVLQEGLMNRLL